MKIEITDGLNQTANGILKNALFIDPIDEKIIADTTQKGSIPGEVYNCLQLMFDLPYPCNPKKLKEFLEDNREYFQEISDGFYTDWDGNNNVGYWPNLGHDEEYHIEEEINKTDLGYEFWYETPLDAVADYINENAVGDLTEDELIDKILDVPDDEFFIPFTRDEIRDVLQDMSWQGPYN
jgi:hypothetical protein